MSALSSFGLIDIALRGMGGTQDRHPADYGGSWIDHLGWAADSAFVAARLLFAGQHIGAAAVLRSQLERWTQNAAYNAGVEHTKGESAADFAARAWSTCHQGYPSRLRVHKESERHNYGADITTLDAWEDVRAPDLFSGPAVTIGENYQVHPASLMNMLSEALHGRGLLSGLARWESALLLEGEPSGLGESTQWLSDALMLNLRQVRLCLATEAEERKGRNVTFGLFALPECTYAGDTAPAAPSLYPLLPKTGLSLDVAAPIKAASLTYGQVFQGKRPAGRLFRDDEMTKLAFYERRARAIKFAEQAFDTEREHFKENFSFAGLESRNIIHIMAAEMSGVLAKWLGQSAAGNAAATCSSALRSAYWLWLEDDDRAMALLRVVLEQCAILRTWSIKPAKAEKLNSNPKTTPKDWMDASGLGRLNSLNRALGEYAHFHARIRLDGARQILEKIQKNGESDEAIFTARGHALEALTALTISETIRATATVSTSIAGAFSLITSVYFEDDGGLDASLENLLDRALLLKNMPLGEYTLHGPATAARDAGTAGS
ncbi:hypothetical protein [Streptomyces sp. 900116325]